MAIDVGNIITLNGSYLKHRITCNNTGCAIYFREDTDLKSGSLITVNEKSITRSIKKIINIETLL